MSVLISPVLNLGIAEGAKILCCSDGLHIFEDFLIIRSNCGSTKESIIIKAIAAESILIEVNIHAEIDIDYNSIHNQPSFGCGKSCCRFILINLSIQVNPRLFKSEVIFYLSGEMSSPCHYIIIILNFQEIPEIPTSGDYSHFKDNYSGEKTQGGSVWRS